MVKGGSGDCTTILPNGCWWENGSAFVGRFGYVQGHRLLSFLSGPGSGPGSLGAVRGGALSDRIVDATYLATVCTELGNSDGIRQAHPLPDEWEPDCGKSEYLYDYWDVFPCIVPQSVSRSRPAPLSVRARSDGPRNGYKMPTGAGPGWDGNNINDK